MFKEIIDKLSIGNHKGETFCNHCQEWHFPHKIEEASICPKCNHTIEDIFFSETKSRPATDFNAHYYRDGDNNLKFAYLPVSEKGSALKTMQCGTVFGGNKNIGSFSEALTSYSKNNVEVNQLTWILNKLIDETHAIFHAYIYGEIKAQLFSFSSDKLSDVRTKELLEHEKNIENMIDDVIKGRPVTDTSHEKEKIDDFPKGLFCFSLQKVPETENGIFVKNILYEKEHLDYIFAVHKESTIYAVTDIPKKIKDEYGVIWNKIDGSVFSNIIKYKSENKSKYGNYYKYKEYHVPNMAIKDPKVVRLFFKERALPDRYTLGSRNKEYQKFCSVEIQLAAFDINCSEWKGGMFIPPIIPDSFKNSPPSEYPVGNGEVILK